MSDENRFFRFVWRFNGIVIMLLLLAALVCVGFHVATHRGMMHWHHATFAHVGKDFQPPQGFSLRPLNGYLFPRDAQTERFYALNKELPREPRSGIPFRHQVKAVTVNILAIDEKTKTSHWLFGRADRAILSEDLLYVSGAIAAGKEEGGIGVIGAAFVVAEADTDKDGVITAKDSQALYFCGIGGKPPVKVIEADRIVVLPYVIGMKEFELFYQKGDKSFAATYLLPKFELVSQIAVSNLPKLEASQDGAITKIGFTGIDQYVE